MKKDCIGIPRGMKLEAGQEANSTFWGHHDRKMLISYADKEKTK